MTTRNTHLIEVFPLKSVLALGAGPRLGLARAISIAILFLLSLCFAATSHGAVPNPQILAPGTSSTPGVFLGTRTPTFRWNSVSGADGYQLVIRRLNAQGGYDVVFDSRDTGDPLKGTSYALPTGILAEGQKYRWNMTSYDNGSYGALGDPRLYFQTIAAPTINSPGNLSADGPPLASLPPTFSWNKVNDADGYRLIIRKLNKEGGYDVVFDTREDLGRPLTGTSYTMPAGRLVAGGKYRWNMASYKGEDYGELSETKRYFQTDSTLLRAPTINSPGDLKSPGGLLETLPPTFRWNSVPGADGYRLLVRKLNNEGNYDVIFDSRDSGQTLKGLSYTLPAGILEAGGKYRWNMASHSSGGYGEIGETRRYFQVGAASVLTPTISEITPGSVVGSETEIKTFTILGARFTEQSMVYLGFRDNNYSQTATPKKPTFISDTKLTISIKVGDDADIWKVWVKNGTLVSNQRTFSVTTGALIPTTTPQFTPIPINTSQDRALTVKNTTASSLNATVAVSAPFSIITGASLTLAAGESKSATIRFKPTSVGPKAATLKVLSSVPGFELPLSGVGEALTITDRDGNGLPDAWEIKHFGSTAVNPQADPDRDGLSNAAEYAGGSDPRDENSPSPTSNNSVPVIFIPGAFGTELWEGGAASPHIIWIDKNQTIYSLDDEHLNVLRPNNDGSNRNEIFPGVPLWSHYRPFYDFLGSEGMNLKTAYFAYDWRLDLSTTASALERKIDEVRASSGSSRVDIVAHSLGGLVAKNYLSKSKANEAKIRKVVFIASPHYGTGKGLEALVKGVDPSGFGGFIINTSTIAHIARNMPAAYQLVPSRALTDQVGALEESTQDLNGDGTTGAMSYVAMFDFLKNPTNKWNRNWGFRTESEALNPLAFQWANLHQNQWDSWTPSDPGLKAYLLYGTGLRTTGTVQVYSNIYGTLFTSVEKDALGDGTVTDFSARCAKLTDSSKVLKFGWSSKIIKIETGRYESLLVTDESVDHFGILGNSRLKEKMGEIFGPNLTASRQNIATLTSLEEPETTPHWIEVRLESESGLLHAYDILNNHTGQTNNGVSETIDASQFTSTQGQQSIILALGGTYRLEVLAQSAGVGRLIITETAGVDPVRRLVYDNLSWTASGKISTEFTELDPEPVLKIDGDGDGISERDVSATAPPVANAGPNQKAREGDVVTLNGSMSFAPEALALAWWQVSGPSVPLSDASAAAPSFVAPEVEEDTLLTFALTATAGEQTSEVDRVSVTVKNIADLAFTRSVSPEAAVVGSSVSYSFVITNTGTRAAHGVKLRDELPEELNFVSSTTSVGIVSRDTNIVTYDIGNLLPGESATITLVVIPNTPGSIVNAPVLSLNEDDENQDNEPAPPTLTVTAGNAADSDNDGIPDWWEQQWFKNLTAAGATTDYDGDRFTDRQEVVAGTNPTSSSSFFQTQQLTVADSGIKGTWITTVSWSSVTGRTYTVERSFDLKTWEVVADGINATAPLNSITNQATPPSGRVFYRVSAK